MIFICFLLLPLSVQARRNPATATFEPPVFQDLIKDSEEVLRDVKDQNFADSCVSYLSALEQNIDGFDVTKLSHSQLENDAEKITNTTWEIRKSLHRNLDKFTPECVENIQSVFRQLRFVEDYFLEFGRKVAHKVPADIEFLKETKIPMRDQTSYYHLQGSGEYKSGDLFITRGLSFLSAMIARLGRRPTQFSHVVMLYEDPQEKKLKTIESYVGLGVGFYEFDYALKNENGRILWLRAKDTKLGEKAATSMGALVASRLAAKNPIKYDYDLDFDDHSTMSCAEVSQVAFKMASDDKFVIPFYPNDLSKGMSLIERLKLKKGQTFEPGDMEIDPRFELIGEFRDLRLTRDMRQKDAIMSSISNWMDLHGYALQDNLTSKLAGGVIFRVRKTFLWPVVKKMLKLEDFSKEIPSQFLKTMSLVNDLGESMLKELKNRDDEYLKKTGIPMTHVDLTKELEKMRVEDLTTYKNKKTKKKAFIHHLLRP